MATGARKADHQICTLNFCIRDGARALINGVAKSQGKFCSDFLINAGRHAAEKALLDLTLVRVDQET